jgi:hypothetical protein
VSIILATFTSVTCFETKDAARTGGRIFLQEVRYSRIYLPQFFFDLFLLSNEVVLFTGAQEENLRVFFRHFLIVDLAPDADMDGYLGFTPPEALALTNSYY